MQDKTSNIEDIRAFRTPSVRKVLVVDDESNVLRVYNKILRREKYVVDSAEDGVRALEKISKEFYDLIIADQSMPRMDGIRLLEETMKIDADVPFIIVTGYGSVDYAVKAMKLGAYDYITKPVDREELLLLVSRAMEANQLKRELRFLRSHVPQQYGFENMVGKSRAMMKLFNTARKVARSEATIHLEGESGTGKEQLAKSIHFQSFRREGPLVTIDCGSLPLQLLQSELFGHIKGAYTGAVSNRRGLFEEARGGTIFLDEIGEIPEPLQLGLLRVIQEREIRPLGSDKSVPVDVRVISATNKNLKQAVDRGEFRRDLYYRLAVIKLEIPPLRERTEDIPSLCQFFLEKYSHRNHKEVTKISPGAMSYLLVYRWEGNVRELENVIERAIVLAEKNEIVPELLPEEIRSDADEGFEIRLPRENLPLKELCARASAAMEKEAIANAIRECDGNKSKAAELLGISRSSLYNKVKALKIG